METGEGFPFFAAECARVALLPVQYVMRPSACIAFLEVILLLRQVGDVRDELEHGERDERLLGRELVDEVGVRVRIRALVVDDRVVHPARVSRDHRAAHLGRDS